jgi:glycine/D-amino acid oxidase-like deaminating enzyme
LNQLIELFQSTIRSYLPEEIEASQSESGQTKFCIRPMTPDGMPIIQQFYSENKKQEIYFLGGTNAGGFVQAPVLATLLLDLIQDTTTNNNLCHIYRSLRLDRNTLVWNT